MNPWFETGDLSGIATPALIVSEDRVRSNLARMVDMAGGPERLRPHMKTHKMAAVLSLQLELGITRCKCATFEEVTVALAAGVHDILWAKQPVGPDLARVVALPASVSVIVDDVTIVAQLDRGRAVFVDVDVGFGRHGVAPAAVPDLLAAAQSAGVRVRGLHVYDGQIHQPELSARTAAFDAAMALLNDLDQAVIVGGGSPTFALHAAHARSSECSPGTPVFWDWGYGTKYPDLPFEPAALVLGRVISKPARDRVCIDIGTKAVAADPAVPRLVIRGLETAGTIIHNEEHLVLEGPEACAFELGDEVLGIPVHVCPTVNLYREAVVVRDGTPVGRWPVGARR